MNGVRRRGSSREGAERAPRLHCVEGSGLGVDGTIWGGEALGCRGGGFERIGTLRPFRLLGGDRCARECRRAALGLLFAVAAELFIAGPAAFTSALRAGLVARRVAPRTIHHERFDWL